MIRNKAIVNEENSDAEYWKQKFLTLMKNGGTSLNNSALNSLSSKSDSMLVDEGSHRVMNSKDENMSPSWNSVLTKQLKE